MGHWPRLRDHPRPPFTKLFSQADLYCNFCANAPRATFGDYPAKLRVRDCRRALAILFRGTARIPVAASECATLFAQQKFHAVVSIFRGAAAEHLTGGKHRLSRRLGLELNRSCARYGHAAPESDEHHIIAMEFQRACLEAVDAFLNGGHPQGSVKANAPN